MKKLSQRIRERFTYRFLALFLALQLSVPYPAFAFKASQKESDQSAVLKIESKESSKKARKEEFSVYRWMTTSKVWSEGQPKSSSRLGEANQNHLKQTETSESDPAILASLEAKLKGADSRTERAGSADFFKRLGGTGRLSSYV